MDREYAICFKMNGVLDEINLHSAVLQQAKSNASYYIKNGATDVTIKLYEEGDLVHQWDWKDGKWVQYE